MQFLAGGNVYEGYYRVGGREPNLYGDTTLHPPDKKSIYQSSCLNCHAAPKAAPAPAIKPVLIPCRVLIAGL